MQIAIKTRHEGKKVQISNKRLFLTLVLSDLGLQKRLTSLSMKHSMYFCQHLSFSVAMFRQMQRDLQDLKKITSSITLSKPESPQRNQNNTRSPSVSPKVEPSVTPSSLVSSSFASSSPSLLEGTFDENESHQSFLEALKEWRSKPESSSRPMSKCP